MHPQAPTTATESTTDATTTVAPPTEKDRLEADRRSVAAALALCWQLAKSEAQDTAAESPADATATAATARSRLEAA